MSYRSHILLVGLVCFGVSIVGVGGAVADTPSDGQDRQATVEAVAQDTNQSDDDDSGFIEQGGGSSGRVPIEIEMGGLDTATVTFGDLDVSNVRFDATIRDADDSGTALVYFDTEAFDESNNGFVAGDGAEVIDTNAEYEDDLPNLATGPYGINASEGETAYYDSESSDQAAVRLENEPPEGDTYDTVSLVVSETGESEEADDSGPGLGVSSALLALAGAGYVMRRTDTSER
jgi:hypothetical protein